MGSYLSPVWTHGPEHVRPFELLLQIYTDDPWAIVSGDDEERDVRMCCLLSLWMVLGLGVAFHKASAAQT